MLAVAVAYPIGVFDDRPQRYEVAPAREVFEEPVPSATPVVVTPKPIEEEAPPPPSKKTRASAPKKKAHAASATAPPPPAPPPPPASPFADKLARVKAAPLSDLRFELADEVEAAADQTLDRDAAARIKACLTQFRITGGVQNLEQCVEKFESARRSVMTP